MYFMRIFFDIYFSVNSLYCNQYMNSLLQYILEWIHCIATEIWIHCCNIFWNEFIVLQPIYEFTVAIYSGMNSLYCNQDMNSLLQYILEWIHCIATNIWIHCCNIFWNEFIVLQPIYEFTVAIYSGMNSLYCNQYMNSLLQYILEWIHCIATNIWIRCCNILWNEFIVLQPIYEFTVAIYSGMNSLYCNQYMNSLLQYILEWIHCIATNIWIHCCNIFWNEFIVLQPTYEFTVAIYSGMNSLYCNQDMNSLLQYILEWIHCIATNIWIHCCNIFWNEFIVLQPIYEFAVAIYSGMNSLYCNQYMNSLLQYILEWIHCIATKIWIHCCNIFWNEFIVLQPKYEFTVAIYSGMNSLYCNQYMNSLLQYILEWIHCIATKIWIHCCNIFWNEFIVLQPIYEFTVAIYSGMNSLYCNQDMNSLLQYILEWIHCIATNIWIHCCNIFWNEFIVLQPIYEFTVAIYSGMNSLYCNQDMNSLLQYILEWIHCIATNIWIHCCNIFWNEFIVLQPIYEFAVAIYSGMNSLYCNQYMNSLLQYILEWIHCIATNIWIRCCNIFWNEFVVLQPIYEFTVAIYSGMNSLYCNQNMNSLLQYILEWIHCIATEIWIHCCNIFWNEFIVLQPIYEFTVAIYSGMNSLYCNQDMNSLLQYILEWIHCIATNIWIHCCNIFWNEFIVLQPRYEFTVAIYSGMNSLYCNQYMNSLLQYILEWIHCIATNIWIRCCNILWNEFIVLQPIYEFTVAIYSGMNSLYCNQYMNSLLQYILEWIHCIATNIWIHCCNIFWNEFIVLQPTYEFTVAIYMNSLYCNQDMNSVAIYSGMNSLYCNQYMNPLLQYILEWIHCIATNIWIRCCNIFWNEFIVLQPIYEFTVAIYSGMNSLYCNQNMNSLLQYILEWIHCIATEIWIHFCNIFWNEFIVLQPIYEFTVAIYSGMNSLYCNQDMNSLLQYILEWIHCIATNIWIHCCNIFWNEFIVLQPRYEFTVAIYSGMNSLYCNQYMNSLLQYILEWIHCIATNIWIHCCNIFWNEFIVLQPMNSYEFTVAIYSGMNSLYCNQYMNSLLQYILEWIHCIATNIWIHCCNIFWNEFIVLQPIYEFAVAIYSGMNSLYCNQYMNSLLQYILEWIHCIATKIWIHCCNIFWNEFIVLQPKYEFTVAIYSGMNSLYCNQYMNSLLQYILEWIHCIATKIWIHCCNIFWNEFIVLQPIYEFTVAIYSGMNSLYCNQDMNSLLQYILEWIHCIATNIWIHCCNTFWNEFIVLQPIYEFAVAIYYGMNSLYCNQYKNSLLQYILEWIHCIATNIWIHSCKYILEWIHCIATNIWIHCCNIFWNEFIVLQPRYEFTVAIYSGMNSLYCNQYMNPLLQYILEWIHCIATNIWIRCCNIFWNEFIVLQPIYEFTVAIYSGMNSLYCNQYMNSLLQYILEWIHCIATKIWIHCCNIFWNEFIVLQPIYESTVAIYSGMNSLYCNQYMNSLLQYILEWIHCIATNIWIHCCNIFWNEFIVLQPKYEFTVAIYSGMNSLYCNQYMNSLLQYILEWIHCIATKIWIHCCNIFWNEFIVLQPIYEFTVAIYSGMNSLYCNQDMNSLLQYILEWIHCIATNIWIHCCNTFWNEFIVLQPIHEFAVAIYYGMNSLYCNQYMNSLLQYILEWIHCIATNIWIHCCNIFWNEFIVLQPIYEFTVAIYSGMNSLYCNQDMNSLLQYILEWIHCIATNIWIHCCNIFWNEFIVLQPIYEFTVAIYSGMNSLYCNQDMNSLLQYILEWIHCIATNIWIRCCNILWNEFIVLQPIYEFTVAIHSGMNSLYCNQYMNALLQYIMEWIHCIVVRKNRMVWKRYCFRYCCLHKLECHQMVGHVIHNNLSERLSIPFKSRTFRWQGWRIKYWFWCVNRGGYKHWIFQLWDLPQKIFSSSWP